MNERYSQPNGVSLLCAEGRVADPFVLLMADHLFEAATLRRLLQQPCPRDGAVLAVDRNVDAVYDLPDATKVVTRGSTVAQIGKDLASYDAIDTGMFLCSRGIFRAVEESVAAGRQSLSDGVRTLARDGLVVSWDIGAASWIDVDTPSAREEAERMMRDGCFDASPVNAGEPQCAERRRRERSSVPRRSDRAPARVRLLPVDDADLVGPSRGLVAPADRTGSLGRGPVSMGTQAWSAAQLSCRRPGTGTDCLHVWRFQHSPQLLATLAFSPRRHRR
jgi:hypothetical protein